MESIVEINASRAAWGSSAVSQRDSVTNGQRYPARREKTLDELVSEIEAEANGGDERILKAAKLLRGLKDRISRGDAGHGVKWTEWALAKFGRGKSWLYQLNAIADSANPEAELARQRRDNAERQKKRNALLVERDPERSSVIKLIRTLDIDDVRKVRQFICHLTGE